MVIGLPKAFLYYRYRSLWETFFEALGHQVVTSGETTRGILAKGTLYAIDEACLSSKIYLGHVGALVGKCDAIFVPRVASLGARDILCTKFEALYDIVRNTFRSQDLKLIDCNIDARRGAGELGAFLTLAKRLGNRRPAAAYAYMLAKQAERLDGQAAARRQEEQLARPGIKVLVAGHSYNVHDAYVGQPVLARLRELGAIPVLADECDRKRAVERSYEVSETLPWVLSRELVGAVREYGGQVDGVVLLSTFPCGPDALVNEIIQRRIKGPPMLTLLMDNQEGTAGVETRLESFVDIIRMKNGVGI